MNKDNEKMFYQTIEEIKSLDINDDQMRDLLLEINHHVKFMAFYKKIDS